MVWATDKTRRRLETRPSMTAPGQALAIQAIATMAMVRRATPDLEFRRAPSAHWLTFLHTPLWRGGCLARGADILVRSNVITFQRAANRYQSAVRKLLRTRMSALR